MNMSRLAEQERSTPTPIALANLLEELQRQGALTITSSQPLPDHPAEFSDVRVSFKGIGSTRTHYRRGKGLGIQAVASGLFECFEHAVTTGDETLTSNKSMCASSGVFKKLTVNTGDVRIPFGWQTSKDSIAFYSTDIQSSQQYLLPASVYDYAYDGNDCTQLRAHRTSNGYAAASTVNDAVLHALLENVERDAFSEFLLTVCLHGTPRGVEIYEDLNIPYIAYLETALKEPVRIWHLSSLIGYVALAETGGRDPIGRIDIGMGCSLNEEYAIERAVLELYQQRSASSEESTDKQFTLRSPAANIERYPALRQAFYFTMPKRSTVARRSLDDSTSSLITTAEQIQTITSTLRNEHGIETYFRELPTNIHSAHVVQVVCPGLEVFHHIRDFVCEPTGRLRTRQEIQACRLTAEVEGKSA